MSFDSVGQATAENTGRFTMKDLKTATALIPPHQHVALLGHLHIVAEIVPAKSSDTDPVLEEEEEYIMPCVLENTSDQVLDLFHKESCESCFVEPLLIYFSCGFTPRGLFHRLQLSWNVQDSPGFVDIVLCPGFTCHLSWMQELSSRVLCAIMLGSYENLLDLYCRLVDIAVDTVHACTVSILIKIHYQ